MVPSDLVKVRINSGKITGRRKPSIEFGMHRKVYLACPQVGAIVHTHSPYTIAVSISSEFVHIIEEAKIVVGTPIVVLNAPSGSEELADTVASAFKTGARAVIVMNHGVVAGGRDIHDARAIVESLEEWSKILTLSTVFGGPRQTLSD
jgi:L-fuculose-phosphate aldolase